MPRLGQETHKKTLGGAEFKFDPAQGICNELTLVLLLTIPK